MNAAYEPLSPADEAARAAKAQEIDDFILGRNPRPSHLAGTVPIGSASVPPLSEGDAVAHQRKLWEAELERYNAGETIIRVRPLETMDTYPTRANDSARPLSAPPRAPEFLEEAAATYRQRSEVYGDTYLKFGPVMDALFPKGMVMVTADDFQRLGVFVQCVSKLARYAENITTGGHADSALDLITYAAMLRELTK